MGNTNHNLASDAPTATRRDTIVALATPPGRSGVAIIRLSGPRAGDALGALGVALPSPRLATLATLRHPENDRVIDQGLVLYFPAPHSFTGEEVVELQVHGSRAVIRCLLDCLAALPFCQLAEPGEFSRRAFINGKMDLVEIEGLADLIDADTDAQRQLAIRQMGGALSGEYETMRGQIVHALALIEAYIDFPDEEIPESVIAEIEQTTTGLKAKIATQLADGQIGEKIREGITIVILGAPNAGKSSLLNALAKRDIAIVSEIAGTTRDALEVEMDINGYAVRLIDTAGLRDSDDPIEQEGIRRARAHAECADLTLHCVSADAADRDQQLQSITHALPILTKSDLAGNLPDGIIATSTRQPGGLDGLVETLHQHLDRMMTGHESPLITRARHREALHHAQSHLRRFSPHAPIELQAEELRQAALQFAKITGTITVDELLDSIFSQFCIGK